MQSDLNVMPKSLGNDSDEMLLIEVDVFNVSSFILKAKNLYSHITDLENDVKRS